MKILFLLSHKPIPRFIKRINIASQVNKTKLIFWDRQLKNDIKFTLPDTVDCEGIKIKAPQGNPIKRSILLMLFCIKSLKKIIQFRPRIIHCGNMDMLLIASIYKITFNRQTRIIYEVGDLPEISLKKNLLGQIFKKTESILLKKIDYLLITSTYFWEEYYKYLVDEEKVKIIPNVPSIKIMDYNKENKLTEIEKKGLTIGFIGSVRYKKQLIMLINAIKDCKDVKLLIAGGGIDLEEIKKYSCENGGNEKITFIGSYDYKQIASLYEKVDLVYGVYDTEKANVKIALPNRLYESIIFEKPLIVSQNTMLSNFVLDKGIGYVVSDKETKQLEFLIKYIVNNQENLIKKIHNCKNIKFDYIYEKYVPEIENMYKI